MIGNNLRSQFTQPCCSMLSKETWLQLGLLRVVMWSGSRFFDTKDIGSKFICTQPILRDVLQSYVQLIQPMHSSSKRFGIALKVMVTQEPRDF